MRIGITLYAKSAVQNNDDCAGEQCASMSSRAQPWWTSEKCMKRMEKNGQERRASA